MSKLLVSLFLSLALIAAPVIAAPKSKTLVFTWNGMEFSLTKKKCANKEVLALAAAINLKPELYPYFYEGVADKIPACWVTDPTNPMVVFIIDEKGNMGTVDLPSKKPAGPAT